MTDTPLPPDEVGTWARVSRRKVVQWGIAYAAGAWGFLQGLAYLSTLLHWPEQLQKLSGLALLIGLPIVLVLAWYHGDRGEQRVRGTELAIITLLFLLGGGLFLRYERASEHATAATSPAPRPLLAADDHSIAVLPFVNMSSDKEQEYFADGISEELLNLLAQVPQLRVIARTSSFSFRGREIEVAEIARRLNVANVLEGSVRKSGDTLRITAQLVRASDSSHLWSQTYDRQLTDVFRIQDEIAQEVVQQLRVKLLGASLPTVQRTDASTYADFLKARQLYRARSRDSLEQATVLLKRIVARDASYAPGWRLLGQAYAEQGYLGFTPLHSGYADSRAALQRSIDVDPTDAAAIAALASLNQDYDWDFPEAARRLKLALSIAPNDETVLRAAARLTQVIGDARRTCLIFEELARRDPLNGQAWADLGYAYLVFGRFRDAIDAKRKALELQPDAVFQHEHIGEAKLYLGDPRGALVEMQQEPHEIMRQLGLSYAYAALGREQESRQILAGLARDHPDWSETAAAGYAILGDADRAFELLARAQQERDPGGVEVRIDRHLRPLQGDPRWIPLLERFGLSDQQVQALDFDIEIAPSGVSALSVAAR